MTREELLDTPIAELEGWGVEPHTVSILEEALGAIYIRDLVSYTPREFIRCKGAGPRSLDSLQAGLRSYAAGDPPLIPAPQINLDKWT
jgi:hypothetical protein